MYRVTPEPIPGSENQDKYWKEKKKCNIDNTPASMAPARSGTVLSFGLISKADAARSVRAVPSAPHLPAAGMVPVAAIRGGIGLARRRHALSAVAFGTWCWTRSLRNRATVTRSSK